MSKVSNKQLNVFDFSDTSSKNLKFRYSGFGKYLSTAVLKKNNLTLEWLASTLDVDEKYANMILSNKIRINKDMAQGLANHFDTSVDYWMQLQEWLNKNKAI